MYRSHDRPRLALAGFFLVLGVAAVQARYQDEKDKKKEVVNYTITVAAVKGGKNITLRPNVRQKVYVRVNNPSAKDEALTVLFRAAGKDEAKGKVEVPSNDKKEVKWIPTPAKKDAIDGPFEIVLADKDGKPLEPKNSAPLVTMSPYEYVSLADAGKGGDRKLSLRVSAKGEFVGPQARVALDIPADRIKGERKGRFSGYVARGTDLILDAEPIEDTTSKDLVDSYSMQIDGIKRGLLFRVTTADGKSTVETNEAGTAALLLPRMTRPTDKLAADVLTSGNIYPDDRVVVSVLSTPYDEADASKDKFVPVATFVGPRLVKMRYDVDLDGSLYLEPVTSEHRVTLDLSGVFGRTKVRVGIYDKDKFDDEGVLKSGAATRAGTEETTQVIHVTDTAPKVELKALRKVGSAKGKETFEEVAVATRGREVIFRATAASDAPIKDVRFVFGKMPADGKVPADAKAGVAEGGDPPAWLAGYLVPAGAKPPLEVTVVVTDELGLSAQASVTLDLIDPLPEATAVSGRVFELDVPIDDLPVILLDAGGTEVAVVRSGPGGKFAFSAVPPGKFFLFARRDQTGAKGMLELNVVKPTRADPASLELKDVELRLEAPTEIKPKDVKKEPKKARISGVVVEDVRRQPGMPVRLIDATGKVVKTAVTDANAAFVFKDLEPGKYAVEAFKSASRTKARVELDLAVGEAKSVGEMKLFR